jgi:hypothetical protein
VRIRVAMATEIHPPECAQSGLPVPVVFRSLEDAFDRRRHPLGASVWNQLPDTCPRRKGEAGMMKRC